MRLSLTQQRVLRILEASPEPLSPRAVANRDDALFGNAGGAASSLRCLERAGFVEAIANGRSVNGHDLWLYKVVARA